MMENRVIHVADVQADPDLRLLGRHVLAVSTSTPCSAFRSCGKENRSA